MLCPESRRQLTLCNVLRQTKDRHVRDVAVEHSVSSAVMYVHYATAVACCFAVEMEIETVACQRTSHAVKNG